VFVGISVVFVGISVVFVVKFESGNSVVVVVSKSLPVGGAGVGEGVGEGVGINEGEGVGFGVGFGVGIATGVGLGVGIDRGVGACLMLSSDTVIPSSQLSSHKAV